MKALTLTACLIAATSATSAAAQQTDRTLVSGPELKQIIAETPYECAGYSAGTETCTAVTLLDVEGDLVRGVARALFAEGFEGSITGTGTLQGSRVCMNPETMTVRLDTPDPAMDRMYESQMKAALEPFGILCTSYYALEKGGYVSVTTQEDGTPIPDGEDSVDFFSQDKTLREAGEEIET